MMKKKIYPVVISTYLLLLAGCSSKQRIEYREQGIEKLKSGSYQEAVSMFDQALDVSGKLSGEFELDVLKYRAEAEYLLADYSAAVDTYTMLIESDKEKPEYLIHRALAYLGDNQVEMALNDYTRGYAASKDVASLKTALFKLSDALLASDQAEKGLVLYEQLIKDGLADGDVYNQFGLCQMKLKAYKSAADLFIQGIEKADKSNRQEMEFNLASSYSYMQDYKKALELFNQYQNTYGEDPAIEKEIAFLKTR